MYYRKNDYSLLISFGRVYNTIIIIKYWLQSSVKENQILYRKSDVSIQKETCRIWVC